MMEAYDWNPIKSKMRMRIFRCSTGRIQWLVNCPHGPEFVIRKTGMMALDLGVAIHVCRTSLKSILAMGRLGEIPTRDRLEWERVRLADEYYQHYIRSRS